MSRTVYVTKTSSFFPNSPVANDDMEKYLGLVDGKPSRVRPIILRQNEIKTRYYALDEQQQITHSNAEMARNAIDGLFNSEYEKSKIQYLACATSMPDQFLPSHASMVHGETFSHPLEIASHAGVCLTSLAALKSAHMSIATGNSDNAVCVASELISPTMLSRFFNEEIEHLKLIEENPHIAFEKDFLRFMLSDGASAVLLSDTPTAELSLRIDWIQMFSYANRQPSCMYMWAEKENDGKLKGWKHFSGKDISEKSIWSLKQDVRQLNTFGIPYFVDAIETALENACMKPEEINYVIPHISSMYFYGRLEEELHNRGMNLPTERWFTNLTWVGNIGSAAPFAALDEFIKTKALSKGDTIMLIVPESGRFSYGIAMLTAV